MKKSFLKWLIVVTAVSLTAILLTNAQQRKQEISRDITGGWIVCVDTLFSTHYECQKPYTAFDFNTDGTYTEYRQSANPEAPKAIQSFNGEWKLVKNKLGLKENDTPGRISVGVIYDIKWTDNDHFYTESSEGDLAKKMYRYFSRKQ